jgi:hypothetical protein
MFSSCRSFGFPKKKRTIMHYHHIRESLFFIPPILALFVVFSQVSLGQVLQETAPSSETMSWSTERDLLVMFEKTDDRVALAEFIVSKCIANTPSQSTTVRIDGLRIAGFVLDREGHSTSARQAFEAILGLTTNDRWLAEAHRMLGKFAFGDGLFADALQSFQFSATHALQEDPNGIFITTQSSLSEVCATASALGQHQICLDYALIGLSLPDPASGAGISGPFYYWAYVGAKGLQDFGLAGEYLDDLLEHYPEYGEDNLFLGLKPMLLMEQHELRGETLDNPSQALLDTISDVLSNEKYYLMPSRAEIAERFASFLDKHNQSEVAAAVADFVFSTTTDAASGESDAFLLQAVGRAQAELALRNAIRKKDRLNDHAGSLQTISLLLESGLPLSVELQDRAKSLYAEINQQPYEPVLVP